MGYLKNAVIGVSWMSAYRVATRILSFVKIAVLARILTPAQFGIFGIASLVLTLLELLTETGVNIFLIQSKKDISEYINSAWVVSIIRGSIISCLIFLSSPFIIQFFRTPDALSILLLISLVPFLRGFINPAVVGLQKELQFKKEFLYRVTVFFTDASVAIIAALITKSVFSLVYGLIAGVLFEIVLSFLLIKPRPKFSLKDGYFRQIFHSGKWVTAYGIFHYFAQQGDTITVGKLLGTSALGVYDMAYKISILPLSEIGDVVSRVVFPVYAKIEGDRDRLKRAFIKSFTSIIITASILGLFIFLFSRQIILVLLGSNWLMAEPVLQILAIYGVLLAISGFASTVFLATGNQRYVTMMTFFRFLGLISTIYPFVSMYGLKGAGYSALLSVCFEIPVTIYCLRRVFWRTI